MIVPTTTAKPFTTDKGATLSRYILYLVCAGQQKAAQLGYSPLPQNLVQDRVRRRCGKIPGHVEPPPINQCDNPTISGEFTDTNTPPPPPSDKQGATPPPTDTPTGPTDNGSGVDHRWCRPGDGRRQHGSERLERCDREGRQEGPQAVALGADKGERRSRDRRARGVDRSGQPARAA